MTALVPLDTFPSGYNYEAARRAYLARHARLRALAVHDDGVIHPQEWVRRRQAAERRAEHARIKAEQSRAAETAARDRMREIAALYRQPCRITQEIVCERYGLVIPQMLSPSRRSLVMLPRQIAMYLVGCYCHQMSLVQIGRDFGGKDHTTVYHAIRKIRALRVVDPLIDRTIAEIEREIAKALEGRAR